MAYLSKLYEYAIIGELTVTPLEIALLFIASVATSSAHPSQAFAATHPSATSPHALQRNSPLNASFERTALRTEHRPEVTVYGYLPYWVANPLEADFDSLTHVAWFSVEVDGDGRLSGTDQWGSIAPSIVERAHAVGTRVHLCVSLFDAVEQDALLNDAPSRARAVTALAELVHTHDADGVNIDFEGMNASSRDGLIAFTRELKDEVGEVMVALPAIDWRGAYDYDELAHASDGLFIMAYDYHWRNGDPGPVAPLTGGDPWSTYAIDWTVDDYRTWGTPDDKIIVGLPLYGYEWPTDSDAVPGTATGPAEAHSMGSILADESLLDIRYDSLTDTPWAWTGSGQLWYDDPESLAIKLSWSVSEGVQGVGFWAIGYANADPDFWEMVDGISGAAPPDRTDDLTDTGESVDQTGGGDTAVDTATPLLESPTGAKGCGCHASGSRSASWWLLSVGLAVFRRRQN